MMVRIGAARRDFAWINHELVCRTCGEPAVLRVKTLWADEMHDPLVGNFLLEAVHCSSCNWGTEWRYQGDWVRRKVSQE